MALQNKNTAEKERTVRIDPDQSPGLGHIRATRTGKEAVDVQALPGQVAGIAGAAETLSEDQAGPKVKSSKEKTVHTLEALALVADKIRGRAWRF